MIIGIITSGVFLDWYHRRATRVGKSGPELRVPPMIVGSIAAPLGLLALGWTAQYRVQWMAPILSTFLVGAGFTAVTLSSWSYLVDAFGIYAASAIAAATALRNAVSASLPLASPGLRQRTGLGLGYTILSLIALAFTPVPILLMKYGQRLRSQNIEESSDNRGDSTSKNT